MGYQLREGLHYCRAGDRAVFLDILAGRYSGLPENLDDALQALEEGREPNRDALKRLSTLGILNRVTQAARPRPCQIDEAPRSSLLETPLPGCQAGTLLRALFVLAATKVEVRRRPLHRTVTRIAHLKAKAPANTNPDRQAQISAAAFSRLGRWVSDRDQCLPRSIAMATMLGKAGVRFDFVFGVAARPFRAHCWIQRGDAVLNDRLENVQQYTPILII